MKFTKRPKTVISTAVCTSALLLSSAASAYQFEAGGSLAFVDYDYDDDTVLNLHGKYYLENLIGGLGPLKEDGFLAKANFVQADYIDYGEADSLGVQGRYMFDPAQNLFVEAELISGDDNDGVADVLRGGVGMYLTDRSEAVASLSRIDVYNEDGFVLSGEYHQLMNIGSGSDLAVDARIALGEYNQIGGGATFYVSELLSFGGSIDLIGHDVYDDTQLSIRGDFFVTDMVQTFVSYSAIDREFDAGFDQDISVFELGAYARF